MALYCMRCPHRPERHSYSDWWEWRCGLSRRRQPLPWQTQGEVQAYCECWNDQSVWSLYMYLRASRGELHTIVGLHCPRAMRVYFIVLQRRIALTHVGWALRLRWSTRPIIISSNTDIRVFASLLVLQSKTHSTELLYISHARSKQEVVSWSKTLPTIDWLCQHGDFAHWSRLTHLLIFVRIVVTLPPSGVLG